jgi:hypothetical protein
VLFALGPEIQRSAHIVLYQSTLLHDASLLGSRERFINGFAQRGHRLQYSQTLTTKKSSRLGVLVKADRFSCAKEPHHQCKHQGGIYGTPKHHCAQGIKGMR